jgi:hypothetical protein
VFTSEFFFLFNLQLGLYEVISKAAFRFLDRNGWPILTDQESQMGVVDILSNSCVHIVLSQSAIDAVDHVPVCNTTSTVTKLKRSISTVTYASKRRRYSSSFHVTRIEISK